MNFVRSIKLPAIILSFLLAVSSTLHAVPTFAEKKAEFEKNIADFNEKTESDYREIIPGYSKKSVSAIQSYQEDIKNFKALRGKIREYAASLKDAEEKRAIDYIATQADLTLENRSVVLAERLWSTALRTVEEKVAFKGITKFIGKMKGIAADNLTYVLFCLMSAIDGGLKAEHEKENAEMLVTAFKTKMQDFMNEYDEATDDEKNTIVALLDMMLSPNTGVTKSPFKTVIAWKGMPADSQAKVKTDGIYAFIGKTFVGKGWITLKDLDVAGLDTKIHVVRKRLEERG